MKIAYPIVMSKGDEYIVVFVPDFNINTQGKSYAEAIAMARDVIGLMGIDMQDDNEQLPQPSDIDFVRSQNPNDTVTLVDVDFREYRRRNDMRSVHRNVTLPGWLDYEAEKSGINVSALLQMALKEKLHLTDR